MRYLRCRMIETIDPGDDWTERQFVAWLRAELERAGIVVEMSDDELMEHYNAFHAWRVGTMEP